jgi:hypothetical protein
LSVARVWLYTKTFKQYFPSFCFMKKRKISNSSTKSWNKKFCRVKKCATQFVLFFYFHDVIIVVGENELLTVHCVDVGMIVKVVIKQKNKQRAKWVEEEKLWMEARTKGMTWSVGTWKMSCNNRWKYNLMMIKLIFIFFSDKDKEIYRLCMKFIIASYKTELANKKMNVSWLYFFYRSQFCVLCVSSFIEIGGRGVRE